MALDMGGTIIMESAFGAGTTFTVELPVHHPTLAAVSENIGQLA